MYRFGTTSKKRLLTCHPLLQKVMTAAIHTSPVDFTIVEGYRSGDKQNEYYEKGTSKAKAGESPHNFDPSLAVDIAPYVEGSLDWEAGSDNYIKLGQHIKKVAQNYNIELEWGGDWGWDYPHWELKHWRDMV